MMDWLEDFKERFGKYAELQDLKAKRIHGNLEINFCDGIPVNVNVKRHMRAKKDGWYPQMKNNVEVKWQEERT